MMDRMTARADETNQPTRSGVRVFAKYTGTDTPPTVQDPMARYLDSLTRSLDLLSLASRTEDEPTPAA